MRYIRIVDTKMGALMSTCLAGRRLLLVSVSTLALAVGSAELRAADVPVARAVLKAPPPGPQPGVLTVWIEGAAFWTGGNDNRTDNLFQVFSDNSGGVFCPSPTGGVLCSLSPTVGFRPRVGWELAFGADYRLAASPWHVSFDVRYGRAKAKDRSDSHSFFTTGGSPNFFSTQTNARYQEREDHFVADFMIGRDIGFGLGQSQVKVGVRVADLEATLNSQGSHIINGYLTEGFGGNGAYHTVAAISVRQHSKFLGVGPRGAIEGAVPLGGPWALDYMGGIAVLFGDRKATADIFFVTGGTKFTAFATQSTISSTSNGSVFNADASAALSYWFTPRAKLSVGFRFDGYWNALRTLDVNGNAVNVDRFYYGPFARLTGSF
jgi:hypothetical protein